MGTKKNGRQPLCECGSGKAAHLCCAGQTKRLVRNGVLVVLIVAVGVTVAALAMTMTATETATTPPAAVVTAPAPYEYDPVTNQHWDPDHGHWHPGPPPQSPESGGEVAAPPHIPNPTPWQYDPATDRHYDPGHGHWHAGPPPAGVDENTLASPVGTDRVDAPPGIVNPAPWQYDAETDRHYHPGHAHWHSGPPPAGQ